MFPCKNPSPGDLENESGRSRLNLESTHPGASSASWKRRSNRSGNGHLDSSLRAMMACPSNFHNRSWTFKMFFDSVVLARGREIEDAPSCCVLSKFETAREEGFKHPR